MPADRTGWRSYMVLVRTPSGTAVRGVTQSEAAAAAVPVSMTTRPVPAAARDAARADAAAAQGCRHRVEDIYTRRRPIRPGERVALLVRFSNGAPARVASIRQPARAARRRGPRAWPGGAQLGRDDVPARVPERPPPRPCCESSTGSCRGRDAGQPARLVDSLESVVGPAVAATLSGTQLQLPARRCRTAC
jgi:hypothetical protein